MLCYKFCRKEISHPVEYSIALIKVSAYNHIGKRFLNIFNI